MTAVSGPSLQLHGVRWWFRHGVPVLDGVDLAVDAGECVVVRGSNGSGKTTLARLAAGVLIPEAGRAVRAPRAPYVPEASDGPPVRLRASRWLGSLARMQGTEPAYAALDALGVRRVVD